MVEIDVICAARGTFVAKEWQKNDSLKSVFFFLFIRALRVWHSRRGGTHISRSDILGQTRGYDAFDLSRLEGSVAMRLHREFSWMWCYEGDGTAQTGQDGVNFLI